LKKLGGYALKRGCSFKNIDFENPLFKHFLAKKKKKISGG
jgi:hypothetical protein